ncbi:MAG TPA: mannose-1-phosphate guanylyltransferase [Lachnospiraceae bacterium]|nr:mannose-1-phosphate guanylyltransferase [Lachnospiraceae bacterium]
MKCLILAGGQGTRMWPLSRKNYPKQFIQIQKNHSLFQETVSRNLPFCDEYIIITRAEYRFIIEDQMKAFQGTPYRCVYEEESRGTLQAIALACMDLVPSEYVFVVVSDHVIYTRPETGNGEMDYKDCVMQAKEYAREGNISLFTLRETIMNPRFGYIFGLKDDGSMDKFVEKPDQNAINNIDLRLEAVYRNLGMLLFEADVFLNEFKKAEPEEYAKCERVFAGRQVDTPLDYSIEGKTYDLSEAEAGMGLNSNYAYYSAKSERVFDEMSIAYNLLEKTDRLKAVKGVFLWSQIDSMEDIPETDISMQGQVVTEDCYNTVVLNTSPNQTIVVNGLDNVMIANTPDAIYIGRYGKSAEIRDIVQSHRELARVAKMGTVFYRPWGHFEQLVQEPGYRVRRVFVPAGHTIPTHSHANRSKNIAVVQGEATIIKGGVSAVYGMRSNIDLPAGCEHSISNAGEETLIFVETTVGDVSYGHEDIIPASGTKVVRKGYNIEPLIRLQPAFKDYLWGGTKLRDIYGMNCDYDIIAEAWMMSAHIAGQSILDSGEYKGMRFGDYLRGAGKEALGWKCSPLQNFPLLVKFIDARDNLSVQVHPNDDYALERENDYGKNEMWYVMAAEEGAGLYVGFNRDVSAEEVAERVKNNTIMEVLNFYPTKPGDVYYIPAGTVHAIGAGNLICEIQQSSNCTYRLYDFDRRDKFGNPRELHLQKALDVLNFNKYVPGEVESEEDAEGTVISRCKYFEATVYDVKGETRIPMDSSKFTSIICMKGSGRLEFMGTELEIESGGSVFVPAMDGILYARGEMTLTLSHV